MDKFAHYTPFTFSQYTVESHLMATPLIQIPQNFAATLIWPEQEISQPLSYLIQEPL